MSSLRADRLPAPPLAWWRVDADEPAPHVERVDPVALDATVACDSALPKIAMSQLDRFVRPGAGWTIKRRWGYPTCYRVCASEVKAEEMRRELLAQVLEDVVRPAQQLADRLRAQAVDRRCGVVLRLLREAQALIDLTARVDGDPSTLAYMDLIFQVVELLRLAELLIRKLLAAIVALFALDARYHEQGSGPGVDPARLVPDWPAPHDLLLVRMLPDRAPPAAVEAAAMRRLPGGLGP